MPVFCFPKGRSYPWMIYFHKKDKNKVYSCNHSLGSFMYEERIICKTFPLPSHLLNALLENQRNLYRKRSRLGRRGSFKKAEGSEKTARVRPAMLGIGKKQKKEKKKSMCKVSDSTEMSSSTQYCFLCSTIQTGIYGFQSPTPTCLRITKMCVKPHIAHTATCAFISTVFKQPWERDILLTFKQWSQCLNLTNWYHLLPRWWWNLLPSHSSYDQAFPHTALKRYSGCSRSRVYPTAA